MPILLNRQPWIWLAIVILSSLSLALWANDDVNSTTFRAWLMSAMSVDLPQEWAALQQRLSEHYVAWRELLSGDSATPSRVLLQQSGAWLLLLIPSTWLLRWLAHTLSEQLLTLHNRLLSHNIKYQAWRATTHWLLSLAPALPWLILAALLFKALPDETSSSQHSLLPWLLLYVVYRWLLVFSDWFLLSCYHRCNVFLSADKSNELDDAILRYTRLATMPWLLLLMYQQWLPTSLLWSWLLTIAIATHWLITSFWLHEHRTVLVDQLKQWLPEQADPVLDKSKQSLVLSLLSPLFVPLLLTLFVRDFIAQLLSDFSWYKRLNARWFRIKTKHQLDEEQNTSNDDISEDYQRWFRDSDDDELELPIIDTGLQQAMRKQFDTWLAEDTEENALLITGEKGIGKSSALRRLGRSLQKEHDDLQVHRIRVPAKTTQPADVYALIGQALERDLSEGPIALAKADDDLPPTVLILNKAENLFLAEVGHFDGWRALLALTNTRMKQVYWIISINNQSWAYLCNVFGREYQMRNVIRVKRWSQTEIRSLILSRNQLSGYRLSYDDVLVDARNNAQGSMRNAEQRYFSLLWDGCRGLPMTALALWQQSVRTKGKKVVVSVPTLPSGARLDHYAAPLMFVFAAIVTHDNLNYEELVMVTNLQENVVRFALKTALDSDIIERGSDGRYRITVFWYHTVLSALQRKNMLHE